MKDSGAADSSQSWLQRRYEAQKKKLADAHEEIERLRKQCLRLEVTVEVLQEQLAAKPTDGGYSLKWSWIDKIVFVVKEAGRPLLSSEIIAALADREEAAIAGKADRVKYFSAFLNTALKYGRLVAEKQKGTRGYFYGLPGWGAAAANHAGGAMF